MASDNIHPSDDKAFNKRVFRGKLNSKTNFLYHSSRASFYDKWDKLILLIIVISGGSALADIYNLDIFKDVKNIKIYSSFIFAVLGGIQLTFSFSKKASLHEVLKSKYADLQGKFELIEFEKNLVIREHMLLYYQAELINLYKDEPKNMLALMNICHNIAIYGSGFEKQEREKNLIKVSFWQKLFKQYWSFESSKVITLNEINECWFYKFKFCLNKLFNKNKEKQ